MHPCSLTGFCWLKSRCFYRQPMKALISLPVCAGWSVSPCGTHVQKCFFSMQLINLCENFYDHKFPKFSFLNPGLAEAGYALPLQTVLIQISWLLKKPRDLDLYCLSFSMWICINNLDQVFWWTENKKCAWLHIQNLRVERKTMVTQTYFWNPCLGATWTPL